MAKRWKISGGYSQVYEIPRGRQPSEFGATLTMHWPLGPPTCKRDVPTPKGSLQSKVKLDFPVILISDRTHGTFYRSSLYEWESPKTALTGRQAVLEENVHVFLTDFFRGIWRSSVQWIRRLFSGRTGLLCTLYILTMIEMLSDWRFDALILVVSES